MAKMVEMKPYQLVNFIEEDEQTITRSVDITLLKWIRCDQSRNKLVTKYMPGPYNDKTNKILYNLIKKNEAPRDNWPEYDIKIVGHADTYEQAINRINYLKIQEFAYTTDPEINKNEKRKIIEHQIKSSYETLPDVPRFTQEVIIPSSKADEPKDNKGKKKQGRKLQEEVSDHQPKIKKVKTSALDTRTESEFSHLLFYHDDESSSDLSDGKSSNNREKTAIDNADLTFLDGLPSTSTANLRNSSSNRKKTAIDTADRIFVDNSASTSTGNLQKGNKNNIKNKNLLKDDNNSKYQFILKDLVLIKNKVEKIADDITVIKAILQSNKAAMYSGQKSFEEDFKLQLPFTTFEDFSKFSETLSTNEECCNRFKAFIDYLSINTDDGIRRSLTIIIKKFFSRELVGLFTAAKKMPNKHLFKDFEFCKKLLEVYVIKFSTAEESVLSHIGAVFSNSKDWDGQRKTR
ncbi:uncharacterized protein LOC122499402 isoform X2 [Leptopilina heterotoma]|uniref:uncharacterized protein LOC122499402 isoform X2 n=1 Tax=Leptopilina heterotoma TaxID=63436 RepID=UPI001CA8699E|nr:uncharacterized protein LOC122499402 isoform X2 [Leptopilina heterotoma]